VYHVCKVGWGIATIWCGDDGDNDHGDCDDDDDGDVAVYDDCECVHVNDAAYVRDNGV
jgi:hypothetical protein